MAWLLDLAHDAWVLPSGIPRVYTAGSVYLFPLNSVLKAAMREDIYKKENTGLHLLLCFVGCAEAGEILCSIRGEFLLPFCHV